LRGTKSSFYEGGYSELSVMYWKGKYIEGTDLSAKLKQRWLKHREAAELVATVCEYFRWQWGATLIGERL
jgi:hypothetical protein